jgi:hypothetical protein
MAKGRKRWPGKYRKCLPKRYSRVADPRVADLPAAASKRTLWLRYPMGKRASLNTGRDDRFSMLETTM